MNVASVAGWRDGFLVAIVDRDGRLVAAASKLFDSRREAERVLAWKRRGRRDLALVQLLTTARVLG